MSLDKRRRDACESGLGIVLILAATLVVTSGALLTSTVAIGAEQRTPEDDVADREFAIAAPEILRIRDLLVSERSCWFSGRTEQLSPEVAGLTNTSVKRPQLRDRRVPLHLRLVERERLMSIQAIQWSEWPPCESPLFPPDKLLDAHFRDHALLVLQCHREMMNRDQIYWHRLGALEEATLRELELPPFTKERMISEARTKTQQTDISMEQLYKRMMASYQRVEDLVRFVEFHAATAYVENGRIGFHDAAVQKDFQKMVNRFPDSGPAPTY
jgi:hypothetical protein